MAALTPIPGRPGKFFDPTLNAGRGGVRTLTSARETDRYDTVEQASGAISAGTTLKFFSNLNNKDDVDQNLPEAGKLVSGSERLILERIGVSLQSAHGTLVARPDDLKRFMAHGYLEVALNRFVIESGPLEKFPAGYGMAGQTNENDAGVVQIGVASTAAQSKFLEQQVITDDHTVKGSITFQSRTWLTTSTLPTLDQAVVARLYMHGLLEEAATQN